MSDIIDSRALCSHDGKRLAEMDERAAVRGGGATEEEREAIRRAIWELYGMDFEEGERS